MNISIQKFKITLISFVTTFILHISFLSCGHYKYRPSWKSVDEKFIDYYIEMSSPFDVSNKLYAFDLPSQYEIIFYVLYGLALIFFILNLKEKEDEKIS